MIHLLDVNVLVALFDGRHVNHETAHGWFRSTCRSRWATCAITQLGVIRILSNPFYLTVSAAPGEVSERLRRFCASGGHVFWPDDLPPTRSLDKEIRLRLQGHRQVTDFHLVALAHRHGGRLATFDARLARSLARTRLASTVALVRAD